MSPSRPNTTERLIPASSYAISAHPMARMSAWSATAIVGSATMNVRDAKPVMNCPIIALARRRRSVVGAVTMRGSVAPAQLRVIPARDLFGRDLQDDALGRARERARLGRGARPRSLLRAHPDDLLDAGGIVDDLAAPANHQPPELRVPIAGLDHHRHARVAPRVDHLLRLRVGGHVDRAILRDEAHRDHVR